MTKRKLVEQLENAFLMDSPDEWFESTNLLTAWIKDNPNCDYGCDCFDNALLMLLKTVEIWNAFIVCTCKTESKIASNWYNDSYCFLLNEMKLNA